ncbi:MAG: hypothetical protein K0S31_2376 [Sphingobacterium multivorum]|jgi:hypothetical protein|nr:hypothetical protein [Sphingobacterium multivorum]
MGELRPKHIKGDTIMDRIFRAFLANKIDSLSETDQRVYERIREVDAQVRTGFVQKITKFDYELQLEVEIHRINRPYQKLELAHWIMARFGVSQAQAYIDIQMSQQFFKTFESKEDKDYARGMHIYWGERMMMEAHGAGDFRAASAFYKELSKVKGLHEKDHDIPDYKEFTPIKPVIEPDASNLGFEKIENLDAVKADLLKELKGKSSSIDRMLEDEAVDVDYEDLEDGEV